MPTGDSQARYGALSITMHWLMFLLLVGVYAAVNLHDLYPRGSELRRAFMTWHFMLGLSVLGLVVARIAIRFAGPPAPPIKPPLSRWQRLLASSVHAALYLFMLAMPILGWLVLGAEGKAIPFFGLDLPALTGPDRDFAHSVEDVHKTIGTIGYYLVGIHAFTALLHHYVIRDTTLTRMLPGHGRRS